MNVSSAEFFEAKYLETADPWDFAESAYEQSRYRVTLESLQGRHFQRALEPGCSIGALSQGLAALCDHVDAFDFSPTAVDAARARCQLLPNITFRCAELSTALSFRDYDLVVLSEIGYYFSAEGWTQLAATLVGDLPLGATLLAVHWLGHSADHQIAGDLVHEILGAQPGLALRERQRHPGFRLDLWIRT